MHPNLQVYTASGTWTKPANLYAIEVIVRGAGGGGSSGMSHATTTSRRCGAGGGGGGVVKSIRRIAARDLPATVAVTVGVGGSGGAVPPSASGAWTPGGNGGHSSFGDLLRAEGGLGGGWARGSTVASIGAGGAGGFGIARGGDGGANGAVGESVTAAPIQLLSGGGGGGGGGGYNAAGVAVLNQIGGWSGFGGEPAINNPVFWQWCQSAGGGWGRSSSSDGGGGGAYPCGGGGGGASGSTGGAGASGAAGLVTVLEYLYD